MGNRKLDRNNNKRLNVEIREDVYNKALDICYEDLAIDGTQTYYNVSDFIESAIYRHIEYTKERIKKQRLDHFKKAYYVSEASIMIGNEIIEEVEKEFKKSKDREKKNILLLRKDQRFRK